MPYITPDDLKSLLGVPADRVVWGQAEFPPETRVAEIIAANSAIIDGMCRGRYAVPFDPVPDEITKICVSLCLGDLLPAVHRNSAEQHKRGADETRQAMALLDRIQQGRLSLQDGDDASHSATGGPVIVSTPSTPRIFSTEDYH